ncbi:hypothetical protein AWJ24_03025 [Escherichia coli]|nr:hypothetical protein AWJ24_03025 [Escherichia coli]OKV62367.1 hypothetical protein AWP57_25625 [Escherichia coli]OKV90382.1 hypothetical protein AWP64_08050 [Escherichia coli]OKW08028.1 hypothetical protein AWP68_05430 [Escherichia coli]OKX18657.1 hypothetical protein AWP93_00665 [Escherichia coli]
MFIRHSRRFFKYASLYIDLCNCLILICSIQHQMKVKLWTTNNCRLWLTNWPKISKPLKISVSSITCSRKSVLRLLSTLN